MFVSLLFSVETHIHILAASPTVPYIQTRVYSRTHTSANDHNTFIRLWILMIVKTGFCIIFYIVLFIHISMCVSFSPVYVYRQAFFARPFRSRVLPTYSLCLSVFFFSLYHILCTAVYTDARNVHATKIVAPQSMRVYRCLRTHSA